MNIRAVRDIRVIRDVRGVRDLMRTRDIRHVCTVIVVCKCCMDEEIRTIVFLDGFLDFLRQ